MVICDMPKALTKSQKNEAHHLREDLEFYYRIPKYHPQLVVLGDAKRQAMISSAKMKLAAIYDVTVQELEPMLKQWGVVDV